MQGTAGQGTASSRSSAGEQESESRGRRRAGTVMLCRFNHVGAIARHGPAGPAGCARRELAAQIQPTPRLCPALARRAAEGPRGRKPGAASSGGEGSADVAALEQDLADALGLRVQLADRGGKGELTIAYGNLEQLDDLCRRLMRG